ncbi:MAG TPA: amidohydrolase family protein [Candidatus Saccharimonadales bacterium]|nr:amidohydrolase family protein [Candidatus Saccharimonadales bacterium]
MIVDSHVHILPASMRDASDELARLDPWFDVCHRGGRVILTVDELLSTMDATGIDRSVCFGWPFADPAHCAQVNDDLIAVQRAHADRLTCFATVSPSRRGAIDELRRCAGEGLRGVGELNADAQGFDPDGADIDSVAALCVDLGIPMVLHCSEPVGHAYPGKGTATPGHVAAFALRNPDLRLVCAHLGGGLPFYAHMPEVAALCRRLWFDTAAGPFLYAPTAYRAVADLCGADRLLFGSDHPLLPARRYIDAFAQAELTVAERALVMGGNAVEFFGL